MVGIAACAGAREGADRTSDVDARLEGADRASNADAKREPIADCPLPQAGECYSEVCGDHFCGPNESAYGCIEDCGYCGDGYCYGEDATWCAVDCGPVCGDGMCTGGETVSSCWDDCRPRLESVRVEKVKYCTSGWPFCNDELSRPEYHWWDHFGVADAKQKETFLARALDPPKANVRRLVFISAGQQFGDGLGLLLTGQPSAFKNHYGYKDKEKTFSLPEGSLPRRLVEGQAINPAQTFLGVAFDARFNQHFWQHEKQDILNAYFHWLKDKVEAQNLDSVYLAGHSRGGCLVARLAQRFNAEFPHVPLVVHVFDGVCTQNQDEFGVDGPQIDNPITNGDYAAWGTDVAAQFTDTRSVRFVNVVGGDLAVDLSIDARAFSERTATGEFTQLFDPTGRAWYEQRWVERGHMAIGNWLSDVTQAVSDLSSSCLALGGC